MENRVYWIDYAKMVGILLVVYGHVTRGLHNAGIAMPEQFYKLTDSIIYTFHMPLFFFLSGIFFYSTFAKKGGLKIVSSKIDTIVYPYLAWSLIQGITEAFLSDFTNSDVSYSEVFALLWSPRSQFWFLYTLFFVFVIATVIFRLAPKKSAVTVFSVSAVLYVFSSILPNDFIFKYIAQNFVYFAFGIVFSIYLSAAYFSRPLPLAISAITFLTGQFLFHQTYGLNYSDKGLASLCLAITSIVFVVAWSSWASRTPRRLLVLIGSSSMAIYLMHILAGSGTRVVLKSFGGVDSYGVHLIAGCLAGVLAPIVATFVLNRLGISYVFAAPFSRAFARLYSKTLWWKGGLQSTRNTYTDPDGIPPKMADSEYRP